MAELKKCPFCGGEAKAVIRVRRLSNEHVIRCANIECAVRPSTPCFMDKEEAVRRWNTRASEAEIRAKAIEEFAGRLSLICGSSGMTVDRYDGRPLYRKDGTWHDLIEDVAEQMKKEVE